MHSPFELGMDLGAGQAETGPLLEPIRLWKQTGSLLIHLESLPYKLDGWAIEPEIFDLVLRIIFECRCFENLIFATFSSNPSSPFLKTEGQQKKRSQSLEIGCAVP